MLEILFILLPFLAVGFIGDIVSGIGSALGGVANAVGDIPILGDVLGSPIGQIGMGLIPGVGPIGAAAMGALGGLTGGGGAQGALGGAAKGFGAQQLMETFQQQRADAERARELTEQAMQRGDQASDIAMQQFQADAPLRQGFRQGAMNFHDPTNPFSHGPMQMPTQQMGQMPGMEPPPAMDIAEPQPTPGGIANRVRDLLSQGSLGRGPGNVAGGVATPGFNPAAGGGGGMVSGVRSPLQQVAHAL